jgi:hypothetical protein
LVAEGLFDVVVVAIAKYLLEYFLKSWVVLMRKLVEVLALVVVVVTQLV